MACLTPVNVRNKGAKSDYAYHSVPCGKCPECKKRRANGWAFRIMKESRNHVKMLFITLTYEQPPISKNGWMTLKREDYQKFMKRLRHLSSEKIKYYACGEYGGETQRPHYHAILFGATEAQVNEAWKLGHTYFGNVNEKTSAYVTKYMCKDNKDNFKHNDDREPEFSLMSKGIGLNYMTPAMIKWHKKNKANYIVVEGGHKQPLPRYYREKIFDEHELKQIKTEVEKKYNQQMADEVRKYGDIIEYYRMKHESVKNTIILANSKVQKSRNKI